MKVLINVASLSGTRVYIPGETHIAAQLRKRSFDSGVYTTIVQVYMMVSDNPKLTEFKTLVDTRFLSQLELPDLEYNLKVIEIVEKLEEIKAASEEAAL